MQRKSRYKRYETLDDNRAYLYTRARLINSTAACGPWSNDREGVPPRMLTRDSLIPNRLLCHIPNRLLCAAAGDVSPAARGWIMIAQVGARLVWGLGLQLERDFRIKCGCHGLLDCCLAWLGESPGSFVKNVLFLVGVNTDALHEKSKGTAWT